MWFMWSICRTYPSSVNAVISCVFCLNQNADIVTTGNSSFAKNIDAASPNN